jgi:acetyltransferase-like isoleucine patch superfamily enzyme
MKVSEPIAELTNVAMRLRSTFQEFLSLFQVIRIYIAKARIWSLNLRNGTRISYSASIAPTAQIQTHSDGIGHGGSISIQENVRLSDGVIIAPYGGSIHIGEGVFIGPYTVLYGHGALSIGAGTMIAAHCVIVASNHTFNDPMRKIRDQPSQNIGISIGEDVWLGAGVRVLDGVSIGNGCVVGAGAVVTRSLDPYTLAVGVPARVYGKRAVPQLNLQQA